MASLSTFSASHSSAVTGAAPTYDCLIVGASFAGLRLAKHLALQGWRVCVLERKQALDQGLHTTGILVQEACELLAPPPQLVRGIKDVALYAPSGTKRNITAPQDYRYYATDTGGLLNWMAEQAQAAGVELRLRQSYTGAVQDANGVYLTDLDVSARFLVAADGARSKVARDFGLGQSKAFLRGAELELEGAWPNDTPTTCVWLSRQLAPGYVAWAMPGTAANNDNRIQVGCAVARKAKPRASEVLQAFDRLLPGLADCKLVGARGGLIPASGAVPPFVKGRVASVGDAAGLVSPLTAGGIHTAILSADILASLLQQRLARDFFEDRDWLAAHYPRFGFKAVQRQIYEHLPDPALELAARVLPLALLAKPIFFRRNR